MTGAPVERERMRVIRREAEHVRALLATLVAGCDRMAALARDAGRALRRMP